MRLGVHFDPTAALSAPAEAVVEPAVHQDAISDEALAGIFGESESAEPATGVEPPEPVAPSEPASPAEPAAEPLESAELDFAALDEPAVAAVEVKTPAADPFIDRLKAYIPSEHVLSEVVSGYQRDTKFQQALTHGNLAGVAEALGDKAPALFEALYQTYKDKIVDRYIQEQAPETPRDPRVDNLTKELDTLKSTFQLGVDRQKAAEHKADTERRQMFVKDSVTTLLDRVKFSKDERDRAFVMKATLVDIASNPELFKRAMDGDRTAVSQALKGVLQTFVERDKARQDKTSAARAKVETQPNPIPVTAGAAGAPVDVFDEASQFVAEKQRRR